MEYDSKSPEAILAFDISYEFYRPNNEEQFCFMDKKDAHICGVISLNQIIEQMNKINVPEENIIIYHKAKELLTYLINQDEK